MPYGCAHAFHPVREAVWLEPAPRGPFAGVARLAAPLYGAPAILPDDSTTVLATYAGFHPRTRFLASPELPGQTLLGRADSTSSARTWSTLVAIRRPTACCARPWPGTCPSRRRRRPRSAGPGLAGGRTRPALTATSDGS